MWRLFDSGGHINLCSLFTPFYSDLWAVQEESGGLVHHYRIGYVFGLRIFKVMVHVPEPDERFL